MKTAGEQLIALTPIFLYPNTQLEGRERREGVVIANIKSHIPGPLFPDARIAISHPQKVL